MDVVCQMASDAQGKGKGKRKQFKEDDENPTFVHHIDAEAAKTWIYPGTAADVPTLSFTLEEF